MASQNTIWETDVDPENQFKSLFVHPLSLKWIYVGGWGGGGGGQGFRANSKQKDPLLTKETNDSKKANLSKLQY